MTVTDPPARPRPKSFRFSTNLERLEGRSAMLGGSDGKPGIRIAPPPEFSGEVGAWSPEHLFVASIDACLLLTFAGLAEKLGLHFDSYQSDAEGLLEWVDGSFAFTEVTLRPRITVRDEVSIALAHDVIARAHKTCLVSNSVTAAVTVESDIVVIS